MALPNESFKLVTPTHVLLHIRDWELADTTLVDPSVTNALKGGEYLTPFITAGKLARADGTGNELAWPFYDQTGAYDLQFFQGKKVPVIMHGSFMADTWLFDRAVCVTLGHALHAELVAVDAINRSVLTHADASEHVVGYTIAVPGSATAPLRYIGNW